MRKPANRLGMYADVRQILDAALAAGGGTYRCPSHGAAVHWRQRAYRFRKLYAELLGADESSPYDSIVMPRCDDSTVQILIRQQVGEFIPAEEPAFVPTIDDPLFDIAKQLHDKLGDDQ